MELLDYVQRLQIITPKPGDILIVTLDKNVTDATSDAVGQYLKKTIDEQGYKDIKILVYNGDMKIDIIRKEEQND